MRKIDEFEFSSPAPSFLHPAETHAQGIFIPLSSEHLVLYVYMFSSVTNSFARVSTNFQMCLPALKMKLQIGSSF